MVMSDPGSAEYIAAYEEVLLRGVPALFEVGADGVPLLQSFDITENLLLSHADAGNSLAHRWFSVMTTCIELFGARRYRFVFPTTLATLILDTFALQDAHAADAPLDLLPPIFRELNATREHLHERSLALLGELFTANLSDAETDTLCRELAARHDISLEYADNASLSLSDTALWQFWEGALGRSSRRERETWRDLTTRLFPSRTQLATATRDRLLLDATHKK